ncbi:hypothetical protein TNCT_483921 [Trichonephila clavata]|uniref:Uncharacterized protein n=1 Tax=Trichonephila clavata TaxID=2740835 RepID=A0A8X6I433_TRICU|nr:hypothetical protein TNCT_483921 [Trichonephila clavata]
MPLKTGLRVSDVYSDSENESINEESPPPSHQASKSPAEACRKNYGTVCAAVLPKDWFSDMDEDGEIRVEFLTTIDGKRFTEIVNDVSEVQCEDVIAKLEAPEKNTDVNIMFMEFSSNRPI